MTELMSSDCDMNVVKTECNESLSNGMQAKHSEEGNRTGHHEWRMNEMGREGAGMNGVLLMKWV